ncbi:MAG: flagellar hook assembly protein FlgD [Methylobacteriaceae bacterium]|nr:flagellar hook assembly protein FlgD [Methylobacteriaceae bacterium]
MATITNPSSLTSGSTGTTAQAAAGAAAPSRTEIAGNFDQFLQLLTTQLKNQSPLDPLDTNQFTQQLVQFASVEQQLKTNDQLTSILSAVKTTSTANAASYVGLDVTADGASASLANGAASWTLTSPRAAPKASLTIKNSAGAIVATRQAALTAGAQTFKWDGKDASGAVQPSGTYTISVSATDTAGQPVAVSTELSGKVTAVDVSGAAPVLTVAGATVPLASVKSIGSN